MKIYLQGNQDLEQVENCIYFGSIINADGRSKKEIRK